MILNPTIIFMWGSCTLKNIAKERYDQDLHTRIGENANALDHKKCSIDKKNNG